jgi:hypothetical protein
MNLWGKPELESDKVELQRDETTFAVGPDALLLDASAQPTKGSIGRALIVEAGQRMTVSAHMKLGEGMKTASLVVNLIGAEGGSHTVLVVNEAGRLRLVLEDVNGNKRTFECDPTRASVAHYLTDDPKYLRGAVAITQYTAGANPMNATMTTGLGHDYPRAPLHVDSRTVGCRAPRGITIYRPHDPAKAPGWVKTWVLGPNMTPPADDWPASELHIDVSGRPEMSEYTVHQSIGPSGYYWGYLAARAAKVGQ